MFVLLATCYILRKPDWDSPGLRLARKPRAQREMRRVREGLGAGSAVVLHVFYIFRHMFLHRFSFAFLHIIRHSLVFFRIRNLFFFSIFIASFVEHFQHSFPFNFVCLFASVLMCSCNLFPFTASTCKRSKHIFFTMDLHVFTFL